MGIELSHTSNFKMGLFTDLINTVYYFKGFLWTTICLHVIGINTTKTRITDPDTEYLLIPTYIFIKFQDDPDIGISVVLCLLTI